jgi:hypothetical protein
MKNSYLDSIFCLAAVSAMRCLSLSPCRAQVAEDIFFPKNSHIPNINHAMFEQDGKQERELLSGSGAKQTLSEFLLFVKF